MMYLDNSSDGVVLDPPLVVRAVGSIEGPSNNQRLALPLGADLANAADAMVELVVSMPLFEQEGRRWLFQARRALDAGIYATNDLQFLGFTVYWEVQFNISAAVPAPGARSTLLLSLNQTRTLGADRRVRFELTAPEGFRFAAPTCFSEAEMAKAADVRKFDVCTASSRTASLTAMDPNMRIIGLDQEVELLVELPHTTPAINLWRLEYFIDSQPTRKGQGVVAGFEVVPMEVSFAGNSQLGVAGPGFFTVVPRANMPGGWFFKVAAPAQRGYRVTCQDFRQGSLPKAPLCEKVQSIQEEAVSIILPMDSWLSQGLEYTFAVGVENGGLVVPDNMNLWSVSVHDHLGNIQGGNRAVPGMRLNSLRLAVPNTVAGQPFDSVMASGLMLMSIVVEATRDLAPGTIAAFLVTPPVGFALATSGHEAIGLPLAASSAGGGLQLEQVPGDFASDFTRLRVTLQSGMAISQGRHIVKVGGSFSGRDSGRPWIFQALDGGEQVVYQQALVAHDGTRRLAAKE